MGFLSSIKTHLSNPQVPTLNKPVIEEPNTLVNESVTVPEPVDQPLSTTADLTLDEPTSQDPSESTEDAPVENLSSEPIPSSSTEIAQVEEVTVESTPEVQSQEIPIIKEAELINPEQLKDISQVEDQPTASETNPDVISPEPTSLPTEVRSSSEEARAEAIKQDLLSEDKPVSDPSHVEETEAPLKKKTNFNLIRSLSKPKKIKCNAAKPVKTNKKENQENIPEEIPIETQPEGTVQPIAESEQVPLVAVQEPDQVEQLQPEKIKTDEDLKVQEIVNLVNAKVPFGNKLKGIFKLKKDSEPKPTKPVELRL